MAESVTIRMPWPPTTNHHFMAIRKGPMAGMVVTSPDVKAYRKLIGDLVLEQNVPRNRVTGKVVFHAEFFPPDNRARDIDNCLKSLQDSLVRAGVLSDDSTIDEMHLYRKAVLPGGGCVMVTITEIPGAATESKPLFDLPLPVTKVKRRARGTRVELPAVITEKPF